MMKKTFILSLSLTSLLLFGCEALKKDKKYDEAHFVHGKQLVVKVYAKSGSKVKGKLTLEQHYDGVIVIGKITGLSAGKHGFHIHEKGDCSAKDASSAGGHFKVGDQVHSDPKDSQAHSGDLGNIEANKDGVAEITLFAKDVTIADVSAKNSIIGKAFIIHASEDDLKSQPAGNSGNRIACAPIDQKVDHK